MVPRRPEWIWALLIERIVKDRMKNLDAIPIEAEAEQEGEGDSESYAESGVEGPLGYLACRCWWEWRGGGL